MPRPKKAGAPQPKKRSRNGCWPCKARKVKCDEAHPSCLNCQRQGEICDYSIRLNWDGRGKRKPEGFGQLVFTSQAETLTPSATNGAEDKVSTTRFEECSFHSGFDGNTRPATATSEAPPQVHTFYDSPQRHLPSQTQPQPQPSSMIPMIDPALVDSQSSSSSIYLQSPTQAYDIPDLTHTQSYERYAQGKLRKRSQQHLASEIFVVPRRQIGQYFHFDKFTPQKMPTPPSLVGDTAVEDEGLGGDIGAINRTFKRVRYDTQSGSGRFSEEISDMRPPYSNSWQHGCSLYPISQGVALNQGSSAAPMIPNASSTHSNEAYRMLPFKTSPFFVAQMPPDFRRLSQDVSDPRRLSVESLLSGPPGIPDEQLPTSNIKNNSRAQTSYPSSTGNVDGPADMKTWGVDRGFRDLDIGKNDDSNAITGGSPTNKREHLGHSSSDHFENIPIEFGFGFRTKDAVFERDHYYAQPVTIKLPRSFEPLPAELLENPMNLLYFHHFISHTARLLVPHHCSSNPFQNILPQMAIEDPNLMNLLLAYSASHRARLLQQPEPTTRIALWVKNVFPNLRNALKDPTLIVSNSNLAAAIMLASLEIISPKAFGVSVSWHRYLLTARTMVHARGGVKSMYYDRSDVSHFLLQWFAYLDVLGSLIDAPTELPSPNGAAESPTLQKSTSGWLGEYDFHDSKDYQIDCLFGFTGRCITILAHIAELARVCDIERIDNDSNVRPNWQPSDEVTARAEKLILDLEAARTNTRVQTCPYLHSADEAAYQWDLQEMAATNEAYHWAGLVHLHRRILGKPSTHVDVQHAVRKICGALYKVRKGSSAEVCLLFPIFTAGCDAQDEKQKAMILERFRDIEDFGMSQVHKARTLMQKVWDTGKPWETLVSGEFVG